MKIDFFYKNALAGIRQKRWEKNERTGIRVKAYPGLTYRTDIGVDGFPLLGLRKIPMSFIPEMMWVVSGSDNVRPWLTKRTPIWDAFAEPDGRVTSAYGMRSAWQLDEVIRKLSADQSTRHAVVSIWDPVKDLTTRQKNVPCPVMFTLNVIEGRLHMHVIVRSNDMVLGFPTDVAGFALLQCMLAQRLGVDPGVYTHSISNAHYYENQEPAVVELLGRKRPLGGVVLVLPDDSLARARMLDDSLVDELKASFKGWHPNDPIRGIPIAI